MIFSYMNSYVSWIHTWIRVYQGSRCLSRRAPRLKPRRLRSWNAITATENLDRYSDGHGKQNIILYECLLPRPGPSRGICASEFQVAWLVLVAGPARREGTRAVNGGYVCVNYPSLTEMSRSWWACRLSEPEGMNKPTIARIATVETWSLLSRWLYYDRAGGVGTAHLGLSLPILQFPITPYGHSAVSYMQ